jgi:ABC-type Na+ efflux pump permease subunit
VGQMLFHSLSVLFGLFSALAGVRYTADSLSGEKREGTLGLLFLTDLKGYDVVLGKLVATSARGVSGLLAIVPVLALPLLMGGVSYGECGRMVLVLLAAMFLSLATGLLASALSRHARRAMTLTFLLLLALHVGLPLLGTMTARTQAVAGGWITMPSLASAYARVSDALYRLEPGHYWASVGTMFGLACLFLTGASVVVRHAWQDRPETGSNGGWGLWWRRLVYGGSDSARAFRRESLEVNPCLWLGARHRLRPLLIWGVLGLIGLVWAGGWLRWGEGWRELEVVVLVLYLMHLALKLTMASEACQRLGPERRDGTLELLLSTPLTVREILRGQMLVLRRQFLGPVLVVLALDVLVTIWGWHIPAGWSRDAWLWFCVVGISTFLADMYTLAWVGLWVGLTARHGNRATGGTVARVLILPWLIWIGLLLLRAWSRVPGGTSGEGGYLTLWFVIALVNNALFLIWSRARLRRDLRFVASERYGAGTPAGRTLSVPGSGDSLGSPLVQPS